MQDRPAFKYIRPTIAAVLKWPRGLDYPPVIYPAGDSDETDRRIVELLEKHLGRRDAS
jgi:hypothetical protein